MDKNVKVVCIQRVYDVQVGNRSTIVRVNTRLTPEDTRKLLEIDNRLNELFEHYEILSQRIIKPLSEDIGREIVDESIQSKVDDPKIELADIPKQKQRLWMILHDMPSDKDFSQRDWVNYMESKKYNNRRIHNNVGHDFAILVKMGKLQKISQGTYRILDKEIYKDDGAFLETMNRLKSGESIVLG